jgi:hypothetical protein
MLLSIGLRVAALCASGLAPVVAAQACNYHVLSNGFDVVYTGVGAGTGPWGTQLKGDGLGTWIAGEDLRGSHITGQTGDFGYRLTAFREHVFLANAHPTEPLAVKFRSIVFVELDGANANNQLVFTNPSCPYNPSLGEEAAPYGTDDDGEQFVLSGLPPSMGPSPSATILVPGNNYSLGGTQTIVFEAHDIVIPVPDELEAYAFQFKLVPSVALLDDIDGLWHYVINSDHLNQYWCMSNDEMNLWQSNSVGVNELSGSPTVITFPANADYDLLLASADPNTTATLAPRGWKLNGPYYAQTENVHDQNGFPSNPNQGFDVGRGSAAFSFSGLAGAVNPDTGVGNQNPTNNPGTLTTIGFATWDNGGDLDGSVRLTWLSIDYLGLFRQNPANDAGVVKYGGQIRAPVVSAGLLQGITNLSFGLFQHVTRHAPSGWPDPGGLASGAFGVPAIGGASWQIPVAPTEAVCIGTKLNVTYGTSGRLGGVGTAGALTWDPSIADVSGTKELYLFH